LPPVARCNCTEYLQGRDLVPVQQRANTKALAARHIMVLIFVSCSYAHSATLDQVQPFRGHVVQNNGAVWVQLLGHCARDCNNESAVAFGKQRESGYRFFEHHETQLGLHGTYVLNEVSVCETYTY
jgi:hypothetical protein